MPGFERAAQRRVRPEEVPLAHELIECLRPQSIGKRSISARTDGAHGPSRPITSTPGGGVKENMSAISFGFLTGLEKLTCVI